MTSPLVVFTTDFGSSDPYAGVIKGVALSINPDLRLIDLTHQISPQNVAQGSFLLGLNHRYFPRTPSTSLSSTLEWAQTAARCCCRRLGAVSWPRTTAYSAG